MLFAKEQLDRRAENQNGKSFTVTGSGVNPFFVLQKERAAAASSSLRPEGAGRSGSAGASGGSGSAEYGLTAESALMDFMASDITLLVIYYHAMYFKYLTSDDASNDNDVPMSTTVTLHLLSLVF